MSGEARGRPEAAAARLSIGALARATGIPVETLRTWEQRYGYPVPERRPSGHREYPVSSVPRLRRVAQALARGHRARQVVGASEAQLAALLEATGAAGPHVLPRVQPTAPPAADSGEDLGPLLAAVTAFDAGGLTRTLLADWARLGPLDFVGRRVAPVVRAVGEAWAARRLDVRHEHFLSERLGDLLRTLRLPLEERATGPLVVIASLPGERHGLGLQMAALVLANAGCRLLFLGPEVPVRDLAVLARDLGARAVAISVSSYTRGPATSAMLAQLRARLPRRVALLVGGEGAPRRRPGVEVLADLEALDGWARAATQGVGPAPGRR